MRDIHTTKPRFARLRKIGKFALFGSVALALCVVVVVWHSRVEKRRAWAEIQKRLDAIRASGEPVTAEDLAKLYPDPPPDRDAALLLAPALAALRLPDSSMELPFFNNVELPSGTQALIDQMRTNIQSVLDDNEAALNAIPWDKLTNAWVGSSFALGFEQDGLSVSMQRLLNGLSKMLLLEPILEGESGNGTKAGESLRRALTLAHIFRSDTMRNHFLRQSREEMGCEILERLMNRVEIPAEELAALERQLSDDPPEGFREAFVMERCRSIFSMIMIPSMPNSAWGISNFNESSLKVAADAQLFGTYMRLSGRLYSDNDFIEMLDVRAAQIAALKLPLKERFDEFARLKKQVASEGSPTYASQFFGAARDWSRHLRSDAETLAKLQVTRAALEIERWRLAHGGRAPDSLADLVPEFAPSIPLDPFDNNPLRYKKLARGFLLYSIGADFTDDGGKEKEGDLTGYETDSDHYDITFSVER